MKRSSLTLVIALVISMAFATGVFAQQTAPQTAPQKAPSAQTPPSTTGSGSAKMEKFSGTVERVDSGAKQFVVKKGTEEKTFMWGDQTKVMEGKKEMSSADLKKGGHVSVQYRKEGDQLMAEKVGMSVPKTAKKTKTTSEK